MIRPVVCTALTIASLGWPTSHAYEPSTHAILSRQAAQNSVLPSILEDYGLEPSFNAGAFIEVGARAEDTQNTLRSINHFYNPRTGSGLSIPTYSSSPHWALAPRESISGQDRSYWDARQYLFDALTKATAAERQQNFGRTFETLGNVVHHIQDMAQPQHVRNEMHCDYWACQLVQPLFGTPSRYEVHSQQREGNLPTGTYDVSSEAFTSAVNSPRRFWHTQPPAAGTDAGKGIAEFTHNNFLSSGTNFLPTGAGTVLPQPDFPLPVPADPQITERPDIRTLLPGTSLQGEVWFIGSWVKDNITGQEVLNRRASTLSIFSDDLQGRTGLRTTTLNSFNFDAAHRYLIPRAIGYSAGMINYFFRGKIDLKKDEQDLSKFRIVNLGPETMSGKFALYYDALDGNRYPVPVDPTEPNRHLEDPNAYRLVIAALDPAVPNSNLSEAISITSPMNDGSPRSPKVQNEYMLVFNGDMGEERAGSGMIGAVAAKAVKAQYNGTLYVRVVSSTRGTATLRTDKSGTRYVASGEFDPYAGNVEFFQHELPAYQMKQVVFTQGLFGPVHRTIALAAGVWGVFRNPRSYAFDGPAGFRLINASGVSWLAKSGDPQVGDFVIGMEPGARPFGLTQLQYTRTFMQGGEPQQETGTMALPSQDVFPEMRNVDVGAFTVSGDGTTYTTGRLGLSSGFGAEELVTSTLTSYRLTLSAVPTAALELSSPETYSTYSKTNASANELVGTYSVTPPAGLCPEYQTPTTFTAENRHGLSESIIRSDTITRRLLGYQNGRLQTFTSTQRLTSTEREEFFGGATTIPVCPTDFWAFIDTRTVATNTVGLAHEAALPGGTVTGNALRLVGDNRITTRGPYNGLYSTAPQPVVQPNGLVETYTGYTVSRALTHRPQDAILKYSESSPTSLRRFRGIDLQHRPFTTDASPSGEVFFATEDKGVIIHEPRGGMPQFQLPPDVTRILSSIWL